MKHIFAVGMKGWVELRECNKPPKLYLTRTVRPVKQVVYVPTDYEATPLRLGYYKDVKRNLTIKTAVYLGGKVVKIMKSRQFAALTKVSVRNGGCLKLPQELIQLVMKEKP